MHIDEPPFLVSVASPLDLIQVTDLKYSSALRYIAAQKIKEMAEKQSRKMNQYFNICKV